VTGGQTPQDAAYVDPARSASSADYGGYMALMCMMQGPTFLQGVSERR